MNMNMFNVYECIENYIKSFSSKVKTQSSTFRVIHMNSMSSVSMMVWWSPEVRLYVIS